MVMWAILALPSALSFGRRVRHDRWARHQHYLYPEVIDPFPSGSTVLNLVNDSNYVVAGESLSNRVIAGFEAPSPLTVQFLSERGVD